MSEKRVLVYLDTGATMEHMLVVKDDSDYLEQMADYMNTWTDDPGSILALTGPLRFYKVQNIVALEFSDPPALSEKLPVGFKTI